MCVNIPNHYEFIKTDNSGVPLAGAKFTVEDASGRIIGTYESGEDGIVSIRDLTPGEYFIKEIETLEGYSVSGEVIRVKINEAYVVPDEMRKFVNYTNHPDRRESGCDRRHVVGHWPDGHQRRGRLIRKRRAG